MATNGQTTWQTACDIAEDKGRRAAMAQRNLGMARDDGHIVEATLNTAEDIWYAAIVATNAFAWQPLEPSEATAFDLAAWALYGYTAEWNV